MNRLALALLLISGTAAADVRRPHRTARWIVVGSLELAHGLLTGPLDDRVAPDHCRWCEPPSLDTSARDHLVWAHRDRARTLSDFTGYGTPVLAASLLALAARDAPCWGRRFADDVLPVVETYVYTELVTELVKISVGRERPDAHFRGERSGAETNLSFYSGHTSIAFSVAVASGVVAQRRGYAITPAIWGSTLALAATTAYLRVAGDRHYLTDVVTGAAAGALGGYAIPTLLDGRDLTIVPTRSGIAIAGAF